MWPGRDEGRGLKSDKAGLGLLTLGEGSRVSEPPSKFLPRAGMRAEETAAPRPRTLERIYRQASMGLNPEAAPSSLKFGTSGLRGLVVELNGTPAFAYTRAFAEMLKEDGSVGSRQEFRAGRTRSAREQPKHCPARLCGPAGIRAHPARLRRSSHAGARLPWHALRDPGDHGDREPHSGGPQRAEILSGSRRDRQTGRGSHPGMACQAGDHSRAGDGPWHPRRESRISI